MSQATQVQSNEAAAQQSQSSGRTETVDMLEFLEAWETSVQDGSGVEGCSAKTGLTADTCQARASKYRNPEYKKVNKTDSEGNTVYRRAKTGENGETETTDENLAKRTKQGKLIPVKVYATDKDGNKIEVRPGLSLSTMPRGGHSRIANKVDEAEALLARLRGETPADESDADESDEG